MGAKSAERFAQTGGMDRCPELARTSSRQSRSHTCRITCPASCRQINRCRSPQSQTSKMGRPGGDERVRQALHIVAQLRSSRAIDRLVAIRAFVWNEAKYFLPLCPTTASCRGQAGLIPASVAICCGQAIRIPVEIENSSSTDFFTSPEPFRYSILQRPAIHSNPTESGS